MSNANKKGAQTSNWKGGRHKTADGYIKVWIDGAYQSEHRLIMETHLGRQLSPLEVVHHINGMRDDNRLENLEVLLRSEHRLYPRHRQEIKWSVSSLGGIFYIMPSVANNRYTRLIPLTSPIGVDKFPENFYNSVNFW